jgi:L-serine kinase (ADP)
MVVRRIAYLDIGQLKPHEEVKDNKAVHLARHMRRSRVLPKPILVDRLSGVILDGHHRFDACKELGCKRVACVLVDYLHDDSVTVESRKKGVVVTKRDVIARGLSGKPFPPKTTKHVHALEEMEKAVPLAKLM